MADSRHNKYVSVTDWFKPAPGSTASGTVSGSTGVATSGASFVGGSWGSGGSGGGLTITIIKTNDTTPESNSNVYSALRVHNSFIAKDKDERTKGKLSSDVGFEVGEFVSGVSGAICYVDPETLQTTAELDRLKVRVKAYFETLEIVNVNSVGGKQIISPAGAINCIRVDEHGGTIDIYKERQATDEEGNPLYDIDGNPIMETYIESVDNGVPEDTYRCYFLAELDGETIENRFHVGDQAYSQMFNAKPGISSNVSSKYYWRLVTGISYYPIEIAGKKYHYIDLSVSDCDTDSDAPSVGDIICHRGHRTLPGDIEGRDRQNALEFSAVDKFSPSITLYQGIGESDPNNGKYPYSLVGKDIIQYGVNRLNNRAFMNVYSDMYIGDRDGQSYLQFDETAGLTVKGNIQFGSKSKMEGDDLTLEERIELASKAYEEDVNQFKAAVEKSFSDVLNQIDGAIETYFLDPEPTLENEPAIDWNTDLLKAAHVGDLYYSKQGNAYRFQYDEITDDDGSKHNLYYWNLIKDTDITLALANAQKALDTADSKRKIFVKQPSTNDSYEEGDMWANATYPATGTPKYSNDLLRAITAKRPGEAFSIDHWVLSSKYTDDTAAIAAQEAADEAQRAANNAQSDAIAAANRLSSWAADNVISPTEKQGIKEEYVRVIKDKDSIHEQWDYYFLDTTASTEIGQIYIAYNNAYLPYVEQLIYLFTAKDSDGVALENIPIPDDFDDNQTSYYSNRTIALNTIAAAAKKVADDAQAAADNAYEEAEKALTAAEEAKTSVYGLNTTVTGLKDFTDDAFLDGIINSSERKTIENYIYQINTVLVQVQQSYSEVVDNIFLVESVAKTNLENSYNSFITAINELLQTVNVISNQGSVENIDRAGFEAKYNNFNSKYSDYTKYLNAAIKFIEYAINSRVDTTLQELGGYSYLKNAFNEETTVTGGLVLTSLIALGYTDDNQQYHVMGGINGSHANNDGIAIWAGGSAVDRAIEPNNPNAADFLVRMDGTGYAAGGNFWWESDGTIHADPLSFVISESSVGALLSSLKVYYNVTNGKPSPYALEPLVPFTKLPIASDIELNSNARLSFGDVYLAYDNVNNSVYIANQNGSPVNFYISGGISMYSAGSMASTSIMDIIAQNIDTNTLKINDQGLLTVIGGGTGGGGSIDFPLSWSGFSSGSFDGSAAKTIYIPSKLSELTNDSGYALSSALSGYLPLSGGTIYGDYGALNIKRSHTSYASLIKFSNDSTTFGYIGMSSNGNGVIYNSDASKFGDILHSNNYSSYALPLTGGTMTGNISWNTDSHGIYFYNGCGIEKWQGYNPSLVAENGTDFFISNKTDRKINYLILHSGNYSSYALPISGGLMGGAIQWGSASLPVSISTSSGYLSLDSKGSEICVAAGNNDSLFINYRKSANGYAPTSWHIFKGDATGYAAMYVGNIYSNGESVIHSGNIGSQSVSYASSAANADKLDGLNSSEFARISDYPKTSDNNWNIQSGMYYTYGGTEGLPLSTIGNSVIHCNWDQNAANQLFLAYDRDLLSFRRKSNNVWSDWKTIAFTDSNVASATKLQTPRTIWGQSFDGTGDISGVLDLKDTLVFSGKPNVSYETHMNNIYQYGLRIYYSNGNEGMMLKQDGNVGFGTTNPDYKLHIVGDTFHNGETYFQSSSTSCKINIGYNQSTWYGESSSYPLIWSGTSTEYFTMIAMPHIPFLWNGYNSYKGTNTGSTIRMAGQPGSGDGSYWDIGCWTNDYFSIGRNRVGNLNINSSGYVGINCNATAMLSVYGSDYKIASLDSAGNLGCYLAFYESSSEIAAVGHYKGVSPGYTFLHNAKATALTTVAKTTEFRVWDDGGFSLGGTKHVCNEYWYGGTTIIGRDGYTKAIIGNLQGKLVFGSHHSNLDAWAPVYLSGSVVSIGRDGKSDIYVNSSGAVGIGTTDPDYKFDVSGEIHASGNAYLYGGSIFAKTYLFMNTDAEGIYLDVNGLNWHDSNNGWTHTIQTYQSDGTTTFHGEIAFNKGYSIQSYNSTPLSINRQGNNIYLCESGYGNVGIGITNPKALLDVNGSVWIGAGNYVPNRATIVLNSNKGNAADIIFKNGSTTSGNFGSWAISTRFESDHRFSIWRGSENASISSELELFKFYSNGDFLVLGGITMYSDQRKKTILKHVELSLKDIANAPLIEHYYNSDDKKTTHVGSIAQYWASMNDWFCKLDNEGYYTMEIQNCALASAISIARELDRYESETNRRIKNLERENALLKEEIRNLKSA